MNKISFNKNIFKKNIFIKIIAMCSLSAGCINHLNPDNLKSPNKISCIKLDNPIDFSQQRCPICANNEVRLEKGLYISEKVDASGTYYRAPSAGIYRGLVHAQKFSNMGYDGGIWVPFDSNVLPRFYIYTTDGPLNPEPVTMPDESITCESLRYIKDPTTQKVSVVQFAAVGTVVGGTVGATLNTSGHINAATGAAGGLIAGGIIAYLENNMYVGKIFFLPENDNETMEKIKLISSKPIYIQEKID